MKSIGIVLIIAGILMFIFRGINYTRKEKVVDLGPLEINKRENKTIGWPVYAGGVAVVAGLVILLAGGKRR